MYRYDPLQLREQKSSSSLHSCLSLFKLLIWITATSKSSCFSMVVFAHIYTLNAPSTHAFLMNYWDNLVYHSPSSWPHKEISAQDSGISSFSSHLRFDSFIDPAVFMFSLCAFSPSFSLTRERIGTCKFHLCRTRVNMLPGPADIGQMVSARQHQSTHDIVYQAALRGLCQHLVGPGQNGSSCSGCMAGFQPLVHSVPATGMLSAQAAEPPLVLDAWSPVVLKQPLWQDSQILQLKLLTVENSLAAALVGASRISAARLGLSCVHLPLPSSCWGPTRPALPQSRAQPCWLGAQWAPLEGAWPSSRAQLAQPSPAWPSLAQPGQLCGGPGWPVTCSQARRKRVIPRVC